MVVFITLTTIIHGILFGYDEYVLNRKRSPSQKEINNALVDGVLYLSVVSMTIFFSYTPTLGKIYIGFGLLSCLSIIKNEYFYENIPEPERLVHSALYVLHPLILYAFYSSWKMNFFSNNLTYWMLQLCYFVLGLKAVSFHIIYWNYIHKK